MIPADELTPLRHQVSLTPWAHDRLKRLLEALTREVQNNPGEYPGYQGRRLTYSDVINLLYERTVSHE